LATSSSPTGSEGVNWRVVALAGRFEAARLCRSPLVVAGFAIAATLIWWNSRNAVPQWWVWDVQVGSTLLAVAGPLLVAAHLAAGRVRRDDATHLYDSYPTSAPARTAAHLLGVAGVVVLAAALAGAAVIWLDLLGPVGAPRPAVLIEGLLLVALGGAIGVALGRYLAHPMSGILAAVILGAAEVDLLLPFSAPVQLPGGTSWLFPWAQPAVLRWLPGSISTIPPALHLIWLLALALLAVVTALLRTGPRPRRSKVFSLTALALVGSLALAGWGGWAQIQLDPGAPNRLAYRVTHPAQIERCTRLRRVRYCAYPGFAADVPRWATVVNGVLQRLPSRPLKPLVVRQVVDADLFTIPLYGGFPPVTPAQVAQVQRLDTQVGRFTVGEGHNPNLVPGSSGPPVYVDVNWGAGGTTGAYQLGLATQVAWWVAGLPTTWQHSLLYHCGPNCEGQAQISCLPVGQAREAIALWLAAKATPATEPAFLSMLRYGAGTSKVGGDLISSYSAKTGFGYQPNLQFTGQAAVLATAMLRLPARRVQAALTARWPGWLSGRTTDAALAAALGIPLPPAPAPIASRFDRGQPAEPVCQ
jgi:hypothetical protein